MSKLLNRSRQTKVQCIAQGASLKIDWKFQISESSLPVKWTKILTINLKKSLRQYFFFLFFFRSKKQLSLCVWISNCSNLDFSWIYIKTYPVLNLIFEFKLLCLFASLDETFISMKHLPCQTTRASLLYTPIRVKVVSWNCELALQGQQRLESLHFRKFCIYSHVRQVTHKARLRLRVVRFELPISEVI